MPQIKLKFLMIDRDRFGNERLYFRRRGSPKVRIKEPMGSPEFWSRYQDLFAGDDAQRVKPQDIDADCRSDAKSKGAPSAKLGFIYFAVFEQGIKIGFTTDPTSRLKAVKQGVGCLIVGFACARGSLLDEKTIHSMLSRYRTRGEWYTREWPIMQIIADMALHQRLRKSAISEILAKASSVPVNQWDDQCVPPDGAGMAICPMGGSETLQNT